MTQRAIPCLYMRGGTSRGPYFLSEDLPGDIATRDRVLLAAMGSPDARQIDGIGGAATLTSKVAIVSQSSQADADVDYLFAQVSIDKVPLDKVVTYASEDTDIVLRLYHDFLPKLARV